MELMQGAKRFTRLAVLEKDDTAFSIGESVAEAMSHPCAKPMTFAEKGSLFAVSAQARPDIFIVDIDLIGSDEHLARLAAQHPQAILIVFGRQGSVSRMLSVLAAGAHDFITLPFDAERLAVKIDGLLSQSARLQRPHAAQALQQANETAEANHAVLAESAATIGENTFDPEPAAITSRHPPSRLSARQVEAVEPLWAQERRIIEHALNTFDGNISQAAAALEISPSTIYRKKQSWADRLLG